MAHTQMEQVKSSHFDRIFLGDTKTATHSEWKINLAKIMNGAVVPWRFFLRFHVSFPLNLAWPTYLECTISVYFVLFFFWGKSLFLLFTFWCTVFAAPSIQIKLEWLFSSFLFHIFSLLCFDNSFNGACDTNDNDKKWSGKEKKKKKLKINEVVLVRNFELC